MVIELLIYLELLYRHCNIRVQIVLNFRVTKGFVEL